MNPYQSLPAVIPSAAVVLPIVFHDHLSPGFRLLASTLLLLLSIKAFIFLREPRATRSQLSRQALLLYFLFWPGIDLAPLYVRKNTLGQFQSALRSGFLATSAGIAFVTLLVMNAAILSDQLLGWLGIAALLITIHFGLSNLITGVMWWLGYEVHSLFVAPLQSSSLRDFWSNRWNHAFVEMNQLIFLPLCRRLLPTPFPIIGVFLISGLLHEYALSFPGVGGYGAPLAYFVIHGILITIESKYLTTSPRSTFAQSCWVFGAVLLPLPLIFHEPFRSEIIVRFFRYLNSGSAAWI